MKKLIPLLIFVFITSFSYGQDYSYVFKVSAIETPGEAKELIPTIRKLTGVKIVKFNDELDQFILLTDYDFDSEELSEKFLVNGVLVEGEIIKTNIE